MNNLLVRGMSSQSPKQTLFEHFAEIAKTLAHTHRLLLLELLAQGERSVEVLAERTGLSLANTSQHLQQLKRAGLVRSTRNAKYVHYRLADDAVLDVLGAVRKFAERNVAEVQVLLRSYFHERDNLKPVGRRDLLKRLKAGDILVMDVRPEDEFRLGHLPGAVNIPLRELKKRLSALDPKLEIVAYCRSHYCVFSYEAVAALRAKGFKVRRLEEGFPEWRAAGLPVAVGNA
jgi:rhodanese-related sulfurtransferase/DNA-binding transcriptional ArsR family regulator